MMANAARYADQLIDELGIRDPKDLLLLEQICWDRGLLIKEDRLDGAEARLVAVGGNGIITISSEIRDPNRWRFAVGHELGHFQMHRPIKGMFLCGHDDIVDIGFRHRQPIENEANEFASAFLLPARFVAPLCIKDEPSLDCVANIANRFSVSLTATAIRYLKFCQEPVAIVYSQEGYIRWFQDSPDFQNIREEFGFFIDVHARLDSDTLACRMFQDWNFPIKKRKVLASIWFTPGRYWKGAKITECSFAMPRYHAVLSLLWIDDILDEDAPF